MEPVPATTMAPSAPPCAPRQAANPSLMKRIDWNGWSISRCVASAPWRPRPARPIPACSDENSSRANPACSAAASQARMIERHALSRPSRIVAGPEPPSPRTMPCLSSMRARQRVPPPSTPRYNGPFVAMTFQRENPVPGPWSCPPATFGSPPPTASVAHALFR